MKRKSLIKIIVVIFICFIAVYFSKSFISKHFFNAMCGEEVIQKTSLNSRYKLKLHQIDCGATTGFSYNLTISKDNKNSKEIMNFEMLEDDPDIEANLSENKLNITYSQPTVISNTNSSYNDLDIRFVRKGKDFKVPSSFKGQRKNSDIDYVSLYDNELEIYQNEEIPAAQVGFAVNNKGEVKSGWNKDWLVVGTLNYEMPIFIDTAKHNSPIYVGQKRNSKWEKVQISTNNSQLQAINKKIDKISDDRFTPEDARENPVKEKDFKEIIKTANEDQNHIKFWEDFLRGITLKPNTFL
ncbi:hypothetical protein O0Q50_21955 [Priestia aryabhattai]|uniref:Uncharacterized protein n=1 Tax=Priestia aryabhattai TaxID=412384 RepID=A0AAX6NDI3_PRIAR|nr:hypothetical protein [Priestia aryabhattai]MDU9693847.1 hypothetical protein [Priestia aryabhattai]